ncbi:protein of unknown function [Streptomyces sp. KY75]|nr:protein of unknown function [Streptomyces sp. KY75]CAD5982430.1 protein of unknown function [Streptomyces sp. KY70]
MRSPGPTRMFRADAPAHVPAHSNAAGQGVGGSRFGGRRAHRTDGCRTRLTLGNPRLELQCRTRAREAAGIAGDGGPTGGNRTQAGTFAPTADHSRSFKGDRRACCQWQVRGCLQGRI